MDELFIYFATPPSVFLLGIFLISRRLIHQITEKDEYLQQPENHRAGNRRMRPFFPSAEKEAHLWQTSRYFGDEISILL